GATVRPGPLAVGPGIRASGRLARMAGSPTAAARESRQPPPPENLEAPARCHLRAAHCPPRVWGFRRARRLPPVRLSSPRRLNGDAATKLEALPSSSVARLPVLVLMSCASALRERPNSRLIG